MTPEERLHGLADGLRRMAWEAEAQAPGRSPLAPLFFHMSRRAAASQSVRLPEDWAALADAFYGVENGLSTEELALRGPIPAQRPKPLPQRRTK